MNKFSWRNKEERNQRRYILEKSRFVPAKLQQTWYQNIFPHDTDNLFYSEHHKILINIISYFIIYNILVCLADI